MVKIRDIILVKMVVETASNIHAFAFDFLFLWPLIKVMVELFGH
jgi:hypothetical protein